MEVIRVLFMDKLGGLTSAIPKARKLAPKIRSCAAGLLGKASRTARKTRDEIRPRRK